MEHIVLGGLLVVIIGISGCTNAATGGVVTEPSGQISTTESESITQNKLTQAECLEKITSKGISSFANFKEECKKIQIEDCETSYGKGNPINNWPHSVACFTILGEEYNDDAICEKIRTSALIKDLSQIMSEISVKAKESFASSVEDSYWYCKARTTQKPDLCRGIKDKKLANTCSLESGGTVLLSTKDCQSDDELNVLNRFRYYDEYCKPVQIDFCKGIENYASLNKADCFLDLAENYEDETLCTYIKIIASKEEYSISDLIYNDYWQCKAITSGNEAYCANIDSVSAYELCLNSV